MKRLLVLSGVLMMNIAVVFGQEKKPVASPPASVTETIASGATIKIDYAQPSVKGRIVGGDVAPFGKVWRTGANAATIFDVSKDVTVEGKALPAGKYSFWTIPGEKEWTVIFDKQTGQWGTQYKESEDALRVVVKTLKAPSAMEKLTYTIDKSGKVGIWWGDKGFEFGVK